MTDDEIREGLRKLCAAPVQTLLCEVKSVDLDKPSLVVETLAENTMYKVRVKTGLDGIIDGWVEVPEVGSWVLVGLIQNDPNTAFLIKTSKVTKVQLTVGNTKSNAENDKFSLESPKIEFNQGKNGGLVLAKKLLTKINALESKHDGLLDYISALTLPVSGATAGPPAAPPIAFKIGTQTTESEISNPKITQ